VILSYKDKTDVKKSVVHNTVNVCNAYLQAGTTNDTFLREHFEWSAKATHWGRFTFISCLGVIHKGNHTKSRELLKPYFPGASE